MSQIKLLQSKINFLTGQLRNLQDSGLFSPEEITDQAIPIIKQVTELLMEFNQEAIARELTVNQAEVLTPETLDKCPS